MSAREAIFDMLKARLDDEHANRCIDAYRAEVLREAADYLNKKYGVTNRAASDLRRLAEPEARRGL